MATKSVKVTLSICDRCGREDPQGEVNRFQRVVFYSTPSGGRSLDLCYLCARDVLRFAEGLDGPFAAIEFTKEYKRRRSESKVLSIQDSRKAPNESNI